MDALPAHFLSYRDRIDAIISQVMDEAFAVVPELSSVAHDGRRMLERYITRPGKRIRGTLVASLYDDITEEQYSPIGLRAAAALEIVQAHLLMIDDVMDESPTRRGEPSLHYVYRDATDVSLREAEMATILFADIAYAVANHSISCLEVPSERVVKALGWLQTDIVTTNIGQFDDLSQSLASSPLYEDIIRRYQQKTGYYSFVNPLSLGLILAGASDTGRSEAEQFGVPAGVAFQLGDDMLGIFGDPHKTGKSNLDDLREGKYTLLMHYANMNADSSQRQVLHRLLGKSDADDADLKKVQRLLHDTGAVEQMSLVARQNADQAIRVARTAESWSSTYGNMLCELVAFLVERSK